MQLLDKTRGPLPGSVNNNRKFAIQYMRKHGFEVMEDTTSEYPEKYNYYLRGELVGWSYDNIIYLQPVLPSLVDMGILAQNYPYLNPGTSQAYADTPKTIIMFTKPIKLLEDAIGFLLDSPSRIDKEIRDKRIENVRKYFDTRKERQEMQEWLV